MAGLFGPRTNPDANIGTKFFDNTTFEGVLGPDGAAKYLVWMANGGTTVSFGRTDTEVNTFYDAFVTDRALQAEPIPIDRTTVKDLFQNSKANMLGVARGTCDQIRTDPAHYVSTYNDYVANKNWAALQGADPAIFGVPMWQDVCQVNNPLTDDLRHADSSSDAVKNWLNTATFNAGVMVYLFLHDELAHGTLAIPRNACELKYPTE